MVDDERANVLAADILSPTVRTIIHHLCQGACRTYGAVLEWCEARGDCSYAVYCPGCSQQFHVDDDELAELQQWTDAEGHALVCGVRWE